MGLMISFSVVFSPSQLGGHVGSPFLKVELLMSFINSNTLRKTAEVAGQLN